MNREKYYSRVEAVLRPDLAKKETFVIIGGGSGGGRVGDETARFGVGKIVLVDRPDETLDEHNLVRHVLGYRDLNRLKVEALRDHLLNVNPDCTIEAVALDVLKDRHRLCDIVEQSTLVHLCTDNEASKHAVNETTVKARVPMIFAGVFDGGCGGEVGRVMPNGACYACMAAYLNRSRILDQDKVETFDYSNPSSQQKSTAAINLDIAQIALIQARIGLLTMLAKSDPAQDLPGNYVLFGNRPVKGLFPRMLCSDIWHIPKDANCLVCGQGAMSDVDIKAASDRILRETICRTN